jgi:hypothetical protein
MTSASVPLTVTDWELARRSSIRAFRAGRYVLILAEGELPTPGYAVDIELDHARVLPARYDLIWRDRDPRPQVVVPYRYGEVVRFPADQPTVMVRHADGEDQVQIEACGIELAEFEAMVADRPDSSGAPDAVEVTGLSPSLRFEEAFVDAKANLPPFDPPNPGALERIDVVEMSSLFGGIADFHHLVVRIRRIIILN